MCVNKILVWLRISILFVCIVYCLPPIQQFFYTSIGSKMALFKSSSHICVISSLPCSNFRTNIRGSCKKFCHWVRITSVLRFIKHIFITNLQNIPPLLKHNFVNFLPSREKQINSLLLVSVGDMINSTAKRTSRCILISRKHFLKPWK